MTSTQSGTRMFWPPSAVQSGGETKNLEGWGPEHDWWSFAVMLHQMVEGTDHYDASYGISAVTLREAKKRSTCRQVTDQKNDFCRKLMDFCFMLLDKVLKYYRRCVDDLNSTSRAVVPQEEKQRQKRQLVDDLDQYVESYLVGLMKILK